MTSKAEKRSSYNKFSFRMAIFGQTIKEQVQNSFGILKPKPTTLDQEFEATLKKVTDLKTFLEISHDSMKNIIKGMSKTMEAEQTFATLLKEESCREDKESVLRIKYINVGDSFLSDYKNIDTKYLLPIKNFESWLNIFLTKVIPDIERTISQCKQTKTELVTYTNILGETRERIRYEVEGSLEYISDKKIISEAEIHVMESKKKFEALKIQLNEKTEMLEIKRKSDLPNYLDSVHNALRLYHESAVSSFTIKNNYDPSIQAYEKPKELENSIEQTIDNESNIENKENASEIKNQLPTQSFGPR